jgi:hypothetical protein
MRHRLPSTANWILLGGTVSMKAGSVRRQFVRACLFFHFMGLALCFGTIFANFAIDRQTRGADLRLLSIGRDLITASSHSLIQTGFLMMVATGILLVLLRYGWRVPVWAWIKFGLSIMIISISILALTPAGDAATQWARWSAEHGQLAPQFIDSIARSGRYGTTILALLLVTTIVAIWKPFANGIRGRRARGEAVETA